MNKLGWDKNFYIANRDMESVNSYEFDLFRSGVSSKKFMPLYLEIELCGICNLKCMHCPFHGIQDGKTGQKHLMPWETLRAVVAQVKKIESIKTLSLTGNGEIFLHPEWYEMIQYIVNEMELDELSMFTNGMMLNEDIIRKLLSINIKNQVLYFSIDGRTPEANDYYRVGAKYEKIKENVKLLQSMMAESDKKIKIVIRNCYPMHEDEVNRGLVDLDELRVPIPDFIKKDFPDLDSVSIATWMPKNNDGAIGIEGFKYVRRSYPEGYIHRCRNPFYVMCINNMGELSRCQSGRADIGRRAGNVFENDLLDMWYNDEAMQIVRKHLVDGDKSPDFCLDCCSRGMGDYYLMIE